jgi:DNA-binding CsgD family transcriptional regulator
MTIVADFTLADLCLDGGTQVRAGLDAALVDDYAAGMTASATFPPVLVVHDGATPYLVDGFHRVHAALQIGRTTIAVELVAGTKQDALWAALGANKTNGQRLSVPDKRHAIQLAVTAWPERSGAQIADQIGCSSQYVSSIKSGMAVTCDRIVTRTGQVRTASPAARQVALDDASRRLQAGESVDVVCTQLRLGRDTVNELRRTLGLGVDKSHTAVRARQSQMRELAGAGHNSHQIAAAVGLSVEGVRATLKRLGVAPIGDKVTRGLHRHDSNRIVGRIVMDAENLTECVNLIDFRDLDRSQLPEWLRSLMKSRAQLSGFIKRLLQETSHGEAA